MSDVTYTCDTTVEDTLEVCYDKNTFSFNSIENGRTISIVLNAEDANNLANHIKECLVNKLLEIGE